MATVMRSRWLHHPGRDAAVICSTGVSSCISTGGDNPRPARRGRSRCTPGRAGPRDSGRATAVRSAPALGIPVHRHHVGEIAARRRRCARCPSRSSRRSSGRLVGHEAVPDMGVAMHQRDVAEGQDARLQTRARRRRSARRAAAARATGDRRDGRRSARTAAAWRCIAWRAASASTRVPTPAPSRGSSHHAAWKRASVCTMRRHVASSGGSGHCVAISCVSVRSSSSRCHSPCLVLPVAVEAARHQARGHRRCDLGIERDFAGALHERPVVAVAGQRHLEDQRPWRCLGCALVAEPQSHDARHKLVARRLGLHGDDASIAQHAAALQRRGEIGGLGRLVQRGWRVSDSISARVPRPAAGRSGPAPRRRSSPALRSGRAGP